jgi:hypothetical protein
MLTLEGIYKDGKVEISPLPASVGQSRVLVTFLEPVEIDLASRGISPEQAADLRARLSTCAEDWDSPEMDIYDVD